MATRIEVFQVTVAAGTLQATPTDTELTFTPARVERMEIMVPPGPSGFVGFAIVHSNQQIIPFQSGSFIVADDEVLRFDLEAYPEGSSWTVRAFNTDIYAHTLHIRLYLDDTPEEVPVGQVAPAEPAEIPPGGFAEDEDIGEFPAEDFTEPLEEELV